jgi:hypothetical protein
MLTCYIKYTLDLDRREQFFAYAKIWMQLIEKYGGTHYGYFLSNEALNKEFNISYSFPELAITGENNIAIALFSFKDKVAYQQYKGSVKHDPLCIEATELLQRSNCFSNYERIFLTAVTNKPENVHEELFALEPIFHRSAQGSTREFFSDMISTDFWEVGASGNIYTRNDVLDIVEARYQTPGYIENDIWQVSDLQCRQVADKTFLVTYLLSQGAEARLTRRSTLWKWKNLRWQAQYHQGTICSETSS